MTAVSTYGKDIYIVSALRTPIAKAPRGALKHQRPDDLGAIAVTAAIAKIPDLNPLEIEDVILGTAFPEAEQGFNLGRIVAQRAGLPDTVAGMTVNRFCASGLQAIALGAQAIAAGQGHMVVAGGVESMSLIPMGGHDMTPNPQLLADLPKVYCTMGATAENLAHQFGISRADQDAFALRSHQRAIAAIESGKFAQEIVPVMVRETLYQGGQAVAVTTQFDTDQGPRADTSLEALAKLPAVFRQGGSVTAGNASQTSDGAAAVVLMDDVMVQQLRLTPMAKFLGFAVAGVPADIMGIGPVEAIPKVLQQVGIGLEEIGLIELNEAFAAQSLAVIRKLGLDLDIVNVNGGAIALGHPLGCSGSRLVVTLLHEMQRRKIRYGLVALCVGGGMGVAAVVENLWL
jgi:acetyl-CoA acyltransferase